MAAAQRSLTTSDGHELTADVAEPEGHPRGSVVLCHPHPLYGGNRFNHVVDALFRALPPAGWRALRFDFRAEHGGGTAERLDVVAAIDAVVRDDEPLIVVGYSFGAVVALNTADDRIAGLVAIAPPLAHMPTPTPTVPTLVLAPEHDQFCAPATAEPIVAGWPTGALEAIPGTDHSIAGRTANVVARTLEWIGEHADPPGAP